MGVTVCDLSYQVNIPRKLDRITLHWLRPLSAVVSHRFVLVSDRAQTGGQMSNIGVFSHPIRGKRLRPIIECDGCLRYVGANPVFQPSSVRVLQKRSTPYDTITTKQGWQ
jgi:hypothetical protein